MKNGLQKWEYALLGRLDGCRNALSFRLQRETGALTVFDPSIDTHNLGDAIIMDACESFLEDAFPHQRQLHLPVHRQVQSEEIRQLRQTKYRFLCGTNLLTSHIEQWWNWQLPPGYRGKSKIRNVILLGVGWNRYEDDCSHYTKLILHAMLNPTVLHAVRDQYTADKLMQAGIRNVLNTGCVTMWGLTPERCRRIPKEKAPDVVTAVTDYRPDPGKDQRMLDILGRNYRTVYLWPQGKGDEAYLSSLRLPAGAVLLPKSKQAFQAVLRPGETDYVGTRLHAGICALNHGVRSKIIGVDNRAAEIGRDTGLPVISREVPETELERQIRQPAATEIYLPEENIRKFRKQFSVRDSINGTKK